MVIAELHKRLGNGQVVATEVPSSQPEFREWVGIHPFRLEHFEYPPERDIDSYPLKYRLVRFRVPRSFDFRRYDVHAEYVETVAEAIECSVDDVVNRLAIWGMDSGNLTGPSECDYPK